MIIEFVNKDGIPVNVDPETVERVMETGAAEVTHLVIGGQEIAVAGDCVGVARLIEDSRATPCPLVRIQNTEPPPEPPAEPPVPAPDSSDTETAVLPRVEDDRRAEKPKKNHK